MAISKMETNFTKNQNRNTPNSQCTNDHRMWKNPNHDHDETGKLACDLIATEWGFPCEDLPRNGDGSKLGSPTK